MKFSIKGFFSKCDQIRRRLRIWSHLLRKSLMENPFFCAVKRPFEKSHMKSDSIEPWYIVFVKHSPVGDNHLKYLEIISGKSLLYPYFDSLIPAVFSAVTDSIFQDNFCCNFLYKIRYYCIHR